LIRWIRASNCAQPTGSPRKVLSRIFAGGPCVISTSTSSGIFDQTCFISGLLAGKLNAQSQNSG